MPIPPPPAAGGDPPTPNLSVSQNGLAGGAAKLSQPLQPTKLNDPNDTYEPTPAPKQRQQLTSTPPRYRQTPSASVERLSTPSSQPRSLRRTPHFEHTPSPELRQVHLAAASLGFDPKAIFADQQPRTPTSSGLTPAESSFRDRLRNSPGRLALGIAEDFEAEPAEQTYIGGAATTSHTAPRISRHTHSAILYTLEEALRHPNPFTPDLVEESASMADLMRGGGIPTASDNQALSSPRRPAAAPTPTGSPGIKGPRMIMQERAEREARRARAEQMEQMKRNRAEQEARLLEDTRQRNAERQAAAAAAGVVAGQGNGSETQPRIDPQRQGQFSVEPSQVTRPSATSQPLAQQRPSRTAPPQPDASAVYSAQPAVQQQTTQPPQGGEIPAAAAITQKTRSTFPHAFERWETLSAHWEGLTSYWLRKLDQNKDEINRDPLSQQLSRQVTDLSAAGANLFHAVVELQRLRASSERKFQRWFFETRAELERSHEMNALLEAAVEKEKQSRADAIRDAVEREQGTSKAQKQLAEMRKELSISKEEARRAWEELGRREQEERDRTLSLQSGQPTIVGGVQVVPMTQAARQGIVRDQGPYQAEYVQGYPAEQAPEQTAAPTTSGGYYQPPELAQPQTATYGTVGSEGGYAEGEYTISA